MSPTFLVISFYFSQNRCRTASWCTTLALMQRKKFIMCGKDLGNNWGLEFLHPVWNSIGRHWHANVHTSTKIHMWAHTSRQTHARTHRAFVLLPQLFPSEQGWLVGGRRGLATGAGQRNSGLFTFSLQPSLFSLFCVFLYSPHSALLPSEDVDCVMKGRRHNYTERVKGRVASQVFMSIVTLSRNAGSKI